MGSLGSVAGITPTARATEGDRISAAARMNRQHRWDAYEPTVPTGNTVHPPNAVLLLMDYAHPGEPKPGHRRRVAEALRELERTFEWHEEGLLFTIGYSAGYFDRFDEDPPAGAAPDEQATVVETVEELTAVADTNDEITPDEYDACLLLSSKNVANVLAAEAALWGDDSGIDGSFDATFEGIFTQPESWPDRRVGFGGPEFQAREEEYEERFLDGEDVVPDEAPLSMGFIAGFGESIPEEEAVTLERGQRFPGPDVAASDVPDLPYVGEVGERDPGVFAQGTLKHLSHLEIDLSAWYGEDGAGDESGDDQRRHQMYSPYHTESETRAKGGDKPGSGLVTEAGSDDGPDQNGLTVREYADRVPETARGDSAAETSEPTVAHSQKSARARYDLDGDGEVEQPVLRRDWDQIMPTGEDSADRAGYIFNVPMRFSESIYTLLDANYNVGFTSLDGRIDHESVDGVAQRNGIAPYMDAVRRGNWLVPPITLRALPHPRGESVELWAMEVDDRLIVAVDADDPSVARRLDPDTVRFGAPEAVDQARGAEPTDVSRFHSSVRFVFDPADVPRDGETVKLSGKLRDTLKPVVGETTL